LDTEPKSNFSRVPVVYRLLATGFGSGYSPIAPGTAGSVVGIILYLPFLLLPPVALLIATVIVFVVGVIASSAVEKVLGEDPSVVVIDEVAGMMISLLYLPPSVWGVLSAFLLFRIFDIFKPTPAREAEQLKNGLGIMTDDLVAGVYANLTTRFLILFLLPG